MNVPLITMVLTLYFQLCLKVDSRNVKFVRCTSIFNPQYFKNLTMYTINGSLYTEADLIQPLVAGFKGKVVFQLRLANAKNYQTICGYNFDVCTMAITYKDNLYKRWYKSILKHGNFVESCPVYEGHYYLNAWHMDPSLIPAVLFAGDYRVKGYFYTIKAKQRKEIFVTNFTIDTAIRDY